MVMAKKKKDKKVVSLLAKIPAAWLAAFLIILLVLSLVFIILLFWNSDKKEGERDDLAASSTVVVNGQSLHQNVFGDHFSNELSIDKTQTNMTYDQETTAYTFTPRYEWRGGEFCSSSYCGEEAKDWSWPIDQGAVVVDNGGSLEAGGLQPESPQEYCLNGKCLKVSGSTLYYRGRQIAIPAALKKAEIMSITIYPLQEDFLVGFVARTQEGSDFQEFGRAYRFNGSRFSDLDPDDSIPLRSRPGFFGAYFGFGGDDDNFLVMYGGYDFLGYQLTNGKKTDLGTFLGLRVSNGGFAPLAFRQSDNWYICSRLNGRPRLIKLWQNGSGSIKGSLDLSQELLQSNGIVSGWCRLGEGEGKLEIIAGQKAGGIITYRRFFFVDQGFRQDQDYQLVSANIFSGQGEVKQARWGGLLACDDAVCGPMTLEGDGRLRFSAGTKAGKLEAAKLGKDMVFSDPAPGLYWQIKATPKLEDSYYSPWIDGLTEVSYSWWQ